MKKLLVALAFLFVAAPAFAQQKFSLTQRASPAPGGAAGDMYYASSASAITRLGIGTDGFCLLVSATTHLPVWQACPSGGISGSGASGRVAFWTGASTMGGDDGFFWDNTTKNLGVGDGSASYRLSVFKTIGTTGGNNIAASIQHVKTGADAGTSDSALLAQVTNLAASGTVGTLIGVNSQFIGGGDSTSSVMENFRAGGIYTYTSITDRIGLHVADATTFEGDGGIVNNYGVKIDTLTGSTSHYSLYTGASPSYFGGNVGIGVVPTYPLHISSTVGATGATFRLIEGDLTVSAADANSRSGFLSSVVGSNTTGTVGSISNFNTFVNLSGNGGTTTTLNNFVGQATVGSGHTLTNRYGLRVNDTSNSGTLTNQYGVYIEDLDAASTLNYGIYTAGAVKNLFSGDTAVGTVAPATSGRQFTIAKSSVYTNGIGSASNPALYVRNTSGAALNEKAEVQLATINGAGLAAITGIYENYIGADSFSTALLFSTQASGTSASSPAATEKMRITGDGKVGIGVTPGQALDVAGKFQVDTNGDIVKLRNATTSFPSANAAGVLTNNGSGTLSWSVAGSGPGTTAGMRTLKETVFAGLGTQVFSNGNTYTLDGSDYTCTCTSCGGSTLEIVASGLRIARTTTAGAGVTLMAINAGSTGDFASIVGEARLRRGRWGLWVRMASYNFGTAGTTAFAGVNVGVYPKWGFSARSRTKNTNGTPATSTGGIAFDHWLFGSDANPTTYPGVTTADVMLVYVSSFNTVEVYYGTYSGGWPDMDAMTYMGRVPGAATWIQAATSAPAPASAFNIWFELGGANAASATYEVIWDRWRITSWD